MTTIPPAPPFIPPSGRRHGCLWGCLAVIVIVFLPVLLAAGYGTWFLYDGWRRDPVLRAASDLVRGDGMAKMVLGDNIQITGLDGNFLSYVGGMAGMGSRAAYVVSLAGSRGEGTLAVAGHTEAGRARIDGLMLAGPDGRRYDLLHHGAAPGAPADDGSSI